jgi:hypothetical protein
MTVNTTNITDGPYIGNGLSSSFSYTFRVVDKQQLSVYETTDLGVETLLTVDTHYTVSGIGNDNGGTITRVAGALPTNYQWFIRSNYIQSQLTAFTSQGAFFPDLHEDAMDKLTFLIQQLEDRLGRSPAVSKSYSGQIPLTLDSPVADRVLRWKPDLSGLTNFDSDSEYVNVSGDMMVGVLSGPDSTSSSGYMPQLQITNLIDNRMSSAPEFDPNNFQDYGLVTQTVNDSNDYGSI